jgi:hypothetical protein
MPTTARPQAFSNHPPGAEADVPVADGSLAEVLPVRARLAEQFTDALVGHGIEPGFTLIELAINLLWAGTIRSRRN